MQNAQNMHFQGDFSARVLLDVTVFITIRHVCPAGVSGHVVMDNIGGREPTFVLSGFTKSGNLTRYLKAEMYRNSEVKVNL